MSRSSISIALCTYNGERYVEEQLRSIAQQTHLPDELVICDDCSTDSTVSMLESFSRAASFPVRIIRNSHNLGSNRNFERAIRSCRGDLIFLCDQDDLWYKEKVSTMLSWFDEHPACDAVFSDGDVIDDQSRSRGRTLWQSIGFDKRCQSLTGREGFHRFLKDHFCVTGAALAFRSHLLGNILPFPDHLAFTYHDAWIARVTSVTGNLCSLPRCLIGYREHVGQQIGFRPEPRGTAGVRQTSQARRERLATAHRQHKALYEELVSRCRGDTSRLEAYQTALEHARHRAELPPSRLARVPLIARELLRGGYSRPEAASIKQIIGDALL